MLDKGVRDDEKAPRIDFEYNFSEMLSVSSESRDWIRKGLIVSVYKSEPIMEGADDEDKKPKMDENNIPELEETCMGCFRVDVRDWLHKCDTSRVK